MFLNTSACRNNDEYEISIVFEKLKYSLKKEIVSNQY